MAARFGVQTDVFDQLISVPAGDGLLKILAGRDAADDVCISSTFRGDASSFHCLVGQALSDPVVFFANDGGARADTVDWASVAGVARNDVARVQLDLANGAQHDLALNGWRAFAYSASSRAEIPVALRAFRADGRELVEFDLRGLGSPLSG